MSVAELTAVPNEFDSWLSAVKACGSARVEVVETFASWVFLTDRHAYKVKKSIDFGDIKFGSLANRRQACIDEALMNRRLAAGVHVGVVPLTRDPGGAVLLGGKGTPIEWAVKMRRLRGDSCLLWLLKHGALTPEHVTALANTMADFYFGAPPETEVLEKLSAILRRRIDESLGPFEDCVPTRLKKVARRIREAQHRYLDGSRMLLNLRVCDGRIVNGHGDLRPEHVFLERQPLVIDCAEYSADRRRCDVLDDLCGLTMECHRQGREDVAESLTATYRRRTSDDEFIHLEAFYRSLQAGSRAVLAVAPAILEESRPTAPQLSEATSYLNQAEADLKEFS